MGLLLQSTFVGLFEVSVSKLKLTTMGRPLREAGVVKILSSIEEDGWIAVSHPVVVLHNESDEKNIDEQNARDMTFRVLDGNHRVAALARRDQIRGGNEDTIITVSVHRRFLITPNASSQTMRPFGFRRVRWCSILVV